MAGTNYPGVASEINIKINADSKQAQKAFDDLAQKFRTNTMQIKSFVKSADAIAPHFGQAATQMGAFKEKQRTANQAMFQFNRTLQDSPFFMQSFNMGFMAISNNLPMFIDSMRGAVTASGSFKEGMKSLGKSLTGSMGMISVMNLAISGILAYSMYSSRAARETKNLKEASEGLAKSLMKFEDKEKPFFFSNESVTTSIEALTHAIKGYNEEVERIETDDFKNNRMASGLSALSSMTTGRLENPGENLLETEKELYDTTKARLGVDADVLKVLEERLTYLKAEAEYVKSLKELGLQTADTIPEVPDLLDSLMAPGVFSDYIKAELEDIDMGLFFEDEFVNFAPSLEKYMMAPGIFTDYIEQEMDNIDMQDFDVFAKEVGDQVKDMGKEFNQLGRVLENSLISAFTRAFDTGSTLLDALLGGLVTTLAQGAFSMFPGGGLLQWIMGASANNNNSNNINISFEQDSFVGASSNSSPAVDNYVYRARQI